MNTGQANQEKRTIKVKDFLDDFRGGMPDDAILKKYHLTPVGLEKFYGMLMERGILASHEIDERYRQESLQAEDHCADLEKSTFICPCCLSSHDTMFDICPNCGVSFQELMSRNAAQESVTNEKKGESKPGRKSGIRDRMFGLFGGRQKEAQLDDPEVGVLGKAGSRGPKLDIRHEDFFQDDDLGKARAKCDDALDEIIPGMPLDYVEDTVPRPSETKAHCDSCDEPMQPALRDVYDRNRSYFTLLLAGASLMLGVLGLTALNLFNSYSLARLLVVYGTGLFLLSGVAFLAAGSFMYLARERVYYCSVCSRVFPRG
jgi:hypothetical protein